MSYNWPGEKAWHHSFADFQASEKMVSLGKQANLGKQENLGMAPADLIEHADYSDYSLPASIRQQLLQSLVYLPASVVGQPDALEKLKQYLRAESSFCWNDYAEQIAQVWQYPVPAHQPYPA
jgi:hypothetical protein